MDSITGQDRGLSRAGLIARGAATLFASTLVMGAAPRKPEKPKSKKRLPCSATKDWPDEYLTKTGVKPRIKPSWTPAEVIKAGQAMATKMVGPDRTLAHDYLITVKKYYADMTQDLTSEYAVHIQTAYPSGNYTTFNAHDFANVHRATWLIMLGSFASLVDRNPHAPRGWGDPPDCKIDRGDTRNYHNVPNRDGFYAINTIDIAVPTVP